MPDGQELSPQDVKDLQQVYAQLPQSHPKKAALGKFISAQPTQFEQERTGPKAGFVGTLERKAGDAWSAIAHPAPETLAEEATRQKQQEGEPDPITATAREAKRQATRPLPPDLQNTPGYRTATTLSSAVPFLNPEASERASDIGDTGAVAAENVIPAAAALAPLAVRGVGIGRRGLRNKVFQELPTSGPKLTLGAGRVSRGIGEVGGAIVGGALSPESYHLGALPGMYVGRELGPSMMERIAGTPELGDIRNPGPFSRVPSRTSRLGTGGALEEGGIRETPFGGEAGGTEGREGRVILPGERVDPLKIESAGSAAQATEGDLRKLAAWGDESAARELTRRRLPPEPRAYSGATEPSKRLGGTFEERMGTAPQKEMTPPPTPSTPNPEPEEQQSPFGTERRTSAGQSPTGTERRTLMKGVSTVYDQPTGGEQLEASLKQSQAGATPNVSEGEVMQQIMRDPTAWAKFRGADAKTQAAMLVKAKGQMFGTAR